MASVGRVAWTHAWCACCMMPFKEALFDPAHVAVIARFDMPVRCLNSDDYAVVAAAHYEDERKTVQQVGLRLG